MDFEPKETHLEKQYGTWSVFAVGRRGKDQDLNQKIGTISYQDRQTIDGASLHHMAEYQAVSTYPPAEGSTLDVDAVVYDPQYPDRYNYLRFKGDLVDCFLIVGNEENGMKVNIAQQSKLDAMVLTLPAESQLSISAQSTAESYEAKTKVGPKKQALLDLFDNLRDVADKVTPEAVIQKPRSQRRQFGSSLLKLVKQ